MEPKIKYSSFITQDYVTTFKILSSVDMDGARTEMNCKLKTFASLFQLLKFWLEKKNTKNT